MQAGTSGQGMGPGYSHEFSDHVPGDDLDGLWLVVRAQTSESFLHGMFISEQYDGAVTLGQGLWVQQGQIRSWSPHYLLGSPNFEHSLPLPYCFHPIQWQGRLARADCRTTESSQGTEKAAMMLCTCTRPPVFCTDQLFRDQGLSITRADTPGRGVASVCPYLT